MTDSLTRSSLNKFSWIWFFPTTFFNQIQNWFHGVLFLAVHVEYFTRFFAWYVDFTKGKEANVLQVNRMELKSLWSKAFRNLSFFNALSHIVKHVRLLISKNEINIQHSQISFIKINDFLLHIKFPFPWVFPWFIWIEDFVFHWEESNKFVEHHVGSYFASIFEKFVFVVLMINIIMLEIEYSLRFFQSFSHIFYLHYLLLFHHQIVFLL